MLQLADNVFIATQYSGINVAAIVTRTGVIGVDMPSYPHDTQDWCIRLRRLSAYPIRQVILTNGHGDRVLNAGWPQAAIVAHDETRALHSSYDKRFPTYMVESLRQRNMLYARDLKNGLVVHPSLSFSEEIVFYADEQPIHLRYAPGPMKGSLFVHLPEPDILFTGDVLVDGSHPLLGNGGSCLDWISTLQRERKFLENVKTIVPGRGPICDASIIDPMIAFLQKVHGIAKEHVEIGNSRATIGQFASDLFHDFPSSSVPTEWLLDELRLTLERAYDELVSPEEQARMLELERAELEASEGFNAEGLDSEPIPDASGE